MACRFHASTFTRTRTAAVTALALAALYSGVSAEPLPAATCGELRGEKSSLLAAGVAQSMNKGPEWAKANLPAAKLGEIERFLDVEALLAFRCRELAAVAPPAPVAADPPSGAAVPKEGGNEAGGARETVAAPPKARPRRAPRAERPAPEKAPDVAN